MGLATIDSHSLKELTEIHKIPKFGVNQASFHCMRYSHLKMSKFTKKCMYGNPDAVRHGVRMPYISL